MLTANLRRVEYVEAVPLLPPLQEREPSRAVLLCHLDLAVAQCNGVSSEIIRDAVDLISVGGLR